MPNYANKPDLISANSGFVISVIRVKKTGPITFDQDPLFQLQPSVNLAVTLDSYWNSLKKIDKGELNSAEVSLVEDDASSLPSASEFTIAAVFTRMIALSLRSLL